MSQSELETKMVPMLGLACIIVAIIAIAIYLNYSYLLGLALGGVFLTIGIALLGLWAWKRSAAKIGQK